MNKFKVQSQGDRHSVIVSPDHGTYLWGDNTNSYLREVRSRKCPELVIVADKDIWSMLSAGNNCTIGVHRNGTLYAWGNNTYGQLGLGDTEHRSYPTEILDQTNWLKVSVGTSHVSGIKTDGSLWSWGYNQHGELGLGESSKGATICTPTRVGKDTDWCYVTSCDHFTVGIKIDGSLWAWGYNAHGRLGVSFEDIDEVIQPERVGNDNDWLQVSGGNSHIIGLKVDGTLWSWGLNEHGQLGLGDVDDITTIPIQVGSSNDWVLVTCGSGYTIALRRDGTLWSWGLNVHGQLGLGDTTNRNIPTRVGSDDDWVMITSGTRHNVGIKKDSTPMVWGCNTGGYLLDINSDGSISDVLVPTSMVVDIYYINDLGLVCSKRRYL